MQILHRTNHRANRRLSHNATRYWARSTGLEVLGSKHSVSERGTVTTRSAHPVFERSA